MELATSYVIVPRLWPECCHQTHLISSRHTLGPLKVNVVCSQEFSRLSLIRCFCQGVRILCFCCFLVAWHTIACRNRGGQPSPVATHVNPLPRAQRIHYAHQVPTGGQLGLALQNSSEGAAAFWAIQLEGRIAHHMLPNPLDPECSIYPNFQGTWNATDAKPGHLHQCCSLF